MKPTLQFDSGRLRPARHEDLERLLAVLRAPVVRRFLCDARVVSRDEGQEMLATSELLDRRGLGLWAIEGGEGHVAGFVGLGSVSDALAHLSDMAGQIEPLVALHPDSFGQGLATAALRALIGYAAVPLRLPRLVAAVDLQNLASHALMGRCGFCRVRTVPGPAQRLVLYRLDLGRISR
ncbi:MAG: GNAT family N-acetyltransferase [Pseudomonadota bacterium]